MENPLLIASRVYNRRRRGKEVALPLAYSATD